MTIRSYCLVTTKNSFLKHESEHFRIMHTVIDTNNIKTLSSYLEDNYARVLADFGYTKGIEKIMIFLYNDISKLRVKMGIPEIDTWAIGGVANSHTIIIMSPNSTFVKQTYTYEAGKKTLVHEFVHCISMLLNPSICNKPNWLWEGVALYEANQYTDLKELEYIRSPKLIPSLKELDLSSNYVKNYDLGYSYVQYIKTHWGFKGVIALIKSSGNIEKALHIPERIFEKRWYMYVCNKYLK